VDRSAYASRQIIIKGTSYLSTCPRIAESQGGVDYHGSDVVKIPTQVGERLWQQWIIDNGH